MGMKLVGMVLTKWAPHVPDRAFRLLMRMAMTALDEPTEKWPADMYFGGRDLLISVLRSERCGNLKALEKSVERGIADLVKLGAIERSNRPRSGFRAEYRLTLMNAIRIDERAVDNSSQPDTHVGAQPDTHVGAQPDTHVVFSPHVGVAPRSNEETLKEQQEEEEADLSGPVPATRERETAEPQINSTLKCGNESCELGFVYDPTRPKGHRNIRCPTCKPDSANVIRFPERRSA